MSSDAEEAFHRESRILDHLVEAGRWDRVLEVAPRLLCDDPENGRIHQVITVAALETRDLRLAGEHSETCVRLDPGDARAHRLRARYFREINRHLLARNAILEALRIDPEDAGTWEEYGWSCYERGDIESARKACAHARALAPSEHSIELLATAVEGAVDRGERLDAFEQIEAFEKSLRLDPECPATHYNIGIIYLEQLGDGKNALEWLRQAARLDPGDHRFRRALHRAACRCDPLLRVIDFPIHWAKRGYLKVELLRVRRPGLLALLLPVMVPAVVILMILFGLWAVFCFVPGKLYQWLMFSEIVRRAGGGERLRYGIYRFPLWARLAVFAVAGGTFCWGAVWILTNPAVKPHFDRIIGGGMILGMLVGLWWSARKHAR